MNCNVRERMIIDHIMFGTNHVVEGIGVEGIMNFKRKINMLKSLLLV